MSQQQVADAVGVNRVRISAWENNVHKPSAENLDALAVLFGTSSRALLSGQPNASVRNENVSRETTAPHRAHQTARAPYVASTSAERSFPTAVRLRENQIERELIDAGATDAQVRDFRRSVRESPLIAALFRGGAPDRVVSEAEMQLYEGVATGFKAIVETMIAEARERARHS